MKAIRNFFGKAARLLLAACFPALGAAEAPAWHPEARPVVELRDWLEMPADWSPGEPVPPDAVRARLAGSNIIWAWDGGDVRGVRWYRATLRLDAPADSLDPLFLRHLAMPRAQEFWWDGKFIGANGTVAGSADGERPGRLLATVRVPPRLSAPGEHELAVRVSNQAAITGGLGEMRVGRLRPLQLSIHVPVALTVFLAGVFFITAVFQFVNFLAAIRRGYALFSVFCLACAVQLLCGKIGPYLGADTDRMQAHLLAGALGWSVMMTTLPQFFLGEFLPRARVLQLCALGAAALPSLALVAVYAGMAPPEFFRIAAPANTVLGLLAVGTSLAAAAKGLRDRRPGAAPAVAGLSGLLVGVIASNFLGTENAWGLGLAFLILVQNASLSRHWQARNLEGKETQLRASRLEIELLKKNIQPHFLLHSLRSITDLLVRNPKTAARLVNALAGELRMMPKMTHEKVIPLAEEIRLCRSHLEVLALRGGLQLSLAEEIATESAGNVAIPPMVLHTLLEQGLEEASPDAKAIRFRLDLSTGRALRLRLGHDAPLRPPPLHMPEETGLRYVRARLEEAYPGRWRLEAGPSGPAGWRAEITFHPSGRAEP